MEDNTLEEAVANFSVSQIPNDTSAPHPRFSLYKQKLSASSQAERRKLYLENQKIKRYDYQSKFRNLVYDDVSEPSEESMDFTVEKLAKKKRINKKYRDQLMLSEWLVEVPDDLCDNWMMLLCPVGKRTLVEASHGTTKSFSRSGFCVNHGFPSHLPGGHKKQRSSHGLTLLDCIFDEKKRIYFILDVICWNGHYVYESDTEFRFYWIKTKLEEIPDLNEKSNSNPVSILLRRKYSCSQIIQKFAKHMLENNIFAESFTKQMLVLL
ncbi:SNUPN (predicted) [Pycnogonum litorale]